LTIYKNKCERANLFEHAYEKETSIMLSDQALTHYYANRVNYFSFDDFCTSMQLFFERPE
jgi:hypothetical protein